MSSAGVIVIAAFLGIALSGGFGGQPHPARTVETPSAKISLELPARLRNGMFFEMRAEVTAKRRFDDMTIAISKSYFRDLTINTMIPAPAEEKSEDSQFVFSYGAVAAGDVLDIKIDGQINPPLFAGTAGTLTIRDGDETVSAIPVKLTVLP